jgi:hypothetical protein
VSRRTADCPACGAKIEFQWSSAVQSACPYCRSILVRHDVDLERVGEVADLPPDASPIQIGTEGVHGAKGFVVIGRIRYEWEAGGWNEWHLIHNDGTSGWLSDAQAEYAVSRLVEPPAPLPAADSLRPGTSFRFSGGEYFVSTITRARYVGFEGELPFRTTERDEMRFADLRSPGAQFGTIDYSEDPPLLFLGEAVSFDSLRLKNLREFEGW